jgi:hypothetical protein
MIELGVNYFVKGESVVFDLKGQDFTFEEFRVVVTDDSMKIQIEDETPMNLLKMLGSIGDPIGVDRQRLLESRSVRFVLRLKVGIFNAYRTRILSVNDIKDLFQLESDGKFPLRSFSNYELDMIGRTSVIEE